ncbi:hypothetical protein [Flavobacterium sp. ov086]|uniref:hypothetical protein n=1 Tax=Flavobacterium sp. ov086 TaxID=1761785 RepID=UPI000B67CF31|nr:hypothetical protein [Flavobacterium sp. ov086]SNR54100.1 hypothetical protein SAMN04487979_110108 [Flavobacterium sp. ov086]
MKTFLFSVLLLISWNIKAQNISEINNVLEIPDTLAFEKEIRIYKDYSTTNGMKILRMYDEGKNNWIVIIYSYSLNQVTKINEIHFPKKNIGKLKPKNAYLIWLNLLITNIEFLPNMESIRYKFGKSYIDADRGEYGIAKEVKHVLDGQGYQVFIKNGENKNYFSFNNPETYLKYYPSVDELIAYNKILSILEKEFSF